MRQRIKVCANQVKARGSGEGNPRAPDPEVLALHARYLSGLSLAAVGRLVNRDASTVQYWFKRAGLPARPKHGTPGWRKAA